MKFHDIDTIHFSKNLKITAAYAVYEKMDGKTKNTVDKMLTTLRDRAELGKTVLGWSTHEDPNGNIALLMRLLGLSVREVPIGDLGKKDYILSLED